ncbi:hypothetical protein EGW08_016798 [Elysia chlorotica]|uniref:Orexin-A n=1 Tax=Elysia chlorotica TaxID=188477 RepID=A0A3S1HAK3_ELYCH|nr:hypothetical protein EGW08_016798 [Elysia chlorotica]
MAAPPFLSSMAARRASLLQTALLFSWVLLVLGQNNGCARRCANSNSEMSRCIRISCRQSAMGAIIRFGKRNRSAGERPSSGVGMMPTREVLLSPSLRENLLESLLARGPEDSLSRVTSRQRTGRLSVT